MGFIPDNDESAFFVREAAWHGVGKVLDYYPGREEAMRLCGHDWDVIELSDVRYAVPNEELERVGQPTNQDGNGFLRKASDWKVHVRSDTLGLLHVSQDSYQSISNSVAYDLAEALLDQGFKFDCGISMEGGRSNAITLLLDEPIRITGDNSWTLPYFAESWDHAARGALAGRYTSIRNVCQNTVSASEAEGAKHGRSFTIRHTKNWKDYVQVAKDALKGVRAGINSYQESMEDLASLQFSPAHRDLFVSEILGETVGFKPVVTSTAASKRVKTNVANERAKINKLFFGATIPEAHGLTGYGFHLAGVEYFDHLRAYRSQESYVKRTLLTDNPAKASLVSTIKALADVAV